MKNIKVVITLLACIASFVASAQEIQDTAKLYPGKRYAFTKINGTRFTGKLLTQDERDLAIDAGKSGLILIGKTDIRAYSLIKDSDIVAPKPVSRTFFYGELGGSGGTHRSFKAALNLIHDYNKIISISYNYSTRDAPDAPSGSGDLFGKAQETLSMFSILGGKVFYTSKFKARFVLRGGITAGLIQTPNNFVATSSWWPDYSYSTSHNIVAGAILNPSIELPAHPGGGVTFGIYANINNVSPVFALEGTMMFGKIRNKTVKELNPPVTESMRERMRARHAKHKQEE